MKIKNQDTEVTHLDQIRTLTSGIRPSTANANEKMTNKSMLHLFYSNIIVNGFNRKL